MLPYTVLNGIQQVCTQPSVVRYVECHHVQAARDVEPVPTVYGLMQLGGVQRRCTTSVLHGLIMLGRRELVYGGQCCRCTTGTAVGGPSVPAPVKPVSSGRQGLVYGRFTQKSG